MNNSTSWVFKNDTVNRYSYAENIFTPEECEKIITYCKKDGLYDGLITGSSNEIGKNPHIRESKISFIKAEEEFYWAYERISDVTKHLNSLFFNFDLWGFSESLQFTEYTAPGGTYGSHIDKMFGGPIRKLSLVVQLTESESYEGGDFELIDSSYPEKLSRKQGTLLVFPSYTLHRVTPLTAGTRNSLVGWVAGKPFK